MIQSGEAARTVRRFFDAYLNQRNIENTLDCLTEGIHWVGTGKSEMVYGRSQAAEALQAEFSQSPESCRIEYDGIEEAYGTDDCSFVILTATVYPGTPSSAAMWFRVSAPCVGDKDGACRIASIHASTPDIRQEEGSFFPASGLSRSEMEARLEAKALDILGRNIPGGMMGGYLEPDFPLYYVNDFMLSYLGYTYEEFVKAIDGKVINCMHPDDRKQVDDLVSEAFDKGTDYQVQYRMGKKDGSYIWVNDVGKKGWSEDGREVCISVIRDISEEVESRIRLERQAGEQEQLAREQEQLADRYNHLLQSAEHGLEPVSYTHLTLPTT